MDQITDEYGEEQDNEAKEGQTSSQQFNRTQQLETDLFRALVSIWVFKIKLIEIDIITKNVETKAKIFIVK